MATIASFPLKRRKREMCNVASMTNTMLCRKLLLVAAARMNSNVCCKLFFIRSFYCSNVLSTEAHSQTLFSQFASTKLKLSEVDITRMSKRFPLLQNFETLQNLEKVIHLFEKRGLTEVQITRIVKTGLHHIRNADVALEPKLKLLEDFGFADRYLVKLLTINPSALHNSLKNNLLPKLEFLKDVFQCQYVLVKVLCKDPRLLSFNLEKTLKPSLAFCEGWGFSGAGLVSFVKLRPSVLRHKSLTPAQVNLIHKIGADQKSNMFKYVLSIVAVSRTKTLEANIENLQQCGLCAEETWQLVGSAPLVINFSKKSISEKMNFIVTNMELPANYVVKHPALLYISLEKTLKPRFLVWQKIKSIDGSELPLLTVLRMAETKFVNKIIKEHPESKMLWTIYQNAISNASNRTKS